MEPSTTTSEHVDRRTRSSRYFDVWHEVPLVPQSTGMSCWAAAAAMVVGWRDRIALPPDAIAHRLRDLDAYREGLLPDQLEDLARAWGLAIEPAADLSAEQLRTLLVEVGPLWIGEASPGLHALVITGMFGDGSADGTFVRINDPWPVQRGERYVLSFRELMQNFRAATEAVGIHAQLMHAAGRGSGARSIQVSRRYSVTQSREGIMRTQGYNGRSTNGHAVARSRGLDVIPASESYLNTASFADDPLATHGGSGENLFVRWTDVGSDATAIDVVLHLHGYSSRDADRALLDDKVRLSGLDLSRRTRTTLALVPRGRHITAAEIASERAAGRTANPSRYTFGGLSAGQGGGLERLIAHTLDWFTRQVLGRSVEAIAIDRLILTAHSGGGAALNALVRNSAVRRVCDPHEVHVFDGIYGDPGRQGNGIVAWANAQLATGGAAGSGALRILYGSGTRTGSRWIAEQLAGAGDTRARFYRVEYAGENHNAIPGAFGPALLADAGADLTLPASRGMGLSSAHAYGTPMGLFNQIPRNRPEARRPQLQALGRATALSDTRSQAEIDWLVSESPEQTAEQSLGLAIRVRALATWAGDSVSVDYRHLQSYPGICQPFTFGPTQLAQLAAANRFVVPSTGVVAFGLRGCRIVDPNDGNFHAEVTLEDDVPDHAESRCVLGVWNLDLNQIAVFRGSTVPHERYMRAQVGSNADKANLLLTGAHRFVVGRHRGRVDGMLREAEPRVVVRSRDDLIYTTSDDFVIAQPGDNLHPSFAPGSTSFSSAGCLTVRGNASNFDAGVSPDTHTDPSDETPGWRRFRERLGLTADRAPAAENGLRFDFLLLTGREAFVASQAGNANDLRRLRFGSQGSEVEALQRFLQSQPSETEGRYAGSVNGIMGPETTLAFIRYQKQRDGGTADGIVGAADAAPMGVALAVASRGARAVSRVTPGRGFPHQRSGVRRATALTDNQSPQAEQSDVVGRNVARSIGQAEAGMRFDLVHDDSNRVNFGIGSWTGTRIADVLDSYEALGVETGALATLHGYFGGQAGFDDIRARFRSDGVGTVLSAAERAQLAALGGDSALQEAQIRHLARDIASELYAIGNTENNPWYPFIDGGMGAISELAAHVLVHAGHQGNRQGMLRSVIAQFGGEAALGASMVSGSVTEADFLSRLGDEVVSRVAARYRTGVRNRYDLLLRSFGGSLLSYYFNPV